MMMRPCINRRPTSTSTDRSTPMAAAAATKQEVTMGRGWRDHREKGKETSSKVVPVVDEEGKAEPYVMVVDDSSVNRAVVTELLRSCKYRVTAVDSGKKALKILGTEPNASMIITDYSMPEMTGYELLKKATSELKQIPVVIMSSEDVPTRINRCLEEGAEDFVIKPVRPADISRIATRMLQWTCIN